ncbi:hypothetical protein ASG30_16690 [Ramlibacter sp. Leaf400]|nr:hypothetical protein ASG30_16690 [Ramlibacter sp. Leaf400]
MTLCAVLLVMMIASVLSVFSLFGPQLKLQTRALGSLSASVSLLLRTALLLAPASVAMPWTSELLSGKRFDVIFGTLATCVALVFAAADDVHAARPEARS